MTTLKSLFNVANSDFKMKKSSFSFVESENKGRPTRCLFTLYCGPDVLHSLCNYLTMTGGMKQSSLMPTAFACFMTFYVVTACRYEKFRAFVNNVQGISM